MFVKNRVSTRDQYAAILANRPRGLALETGRCAAPPDAIQTFASTEGALLATLGTTLGGIASGVLLLLTQINNSPGPISASDQSLLNTAITQTQALVTQAQAISTTPQAPAA